MAKKKQGRFSRYIRPTTYLIDLSIINFLVIREILNNTPDEWLCLLISAIWIIISIFSRFYNIYRYTPEIKILNLLLVQFSLFLLAMFSVSGIFPLLEIAPKTVLLFTLYVALAIGLIKFSIYYFMLKFRADFGGNYRRTVIIGNGTESQSLERFFDLSLIHI